MVGFRKFYSTPSTSPSQAAHPLHATHSVRSGSKSRTKMTIGGWATSRRAPNSLTRPADVWVPSSVTGAGMYNFLLQLQLAHVLHRTDIWADHTSLRVVVVVEPMSAPSAPEGRGEEAGEEGDAHRSSPPPVSAWAATSGDDAEGSWADVAEAERERFLEVVEASRVVADVEVRPLTLALTHARH